MRDLKFCSKNSKVGGEFEELTIVLNQQAEEIKNVVSVMTLGEHIRNENFDIFLQNIENYFLETKKDLDQFYERCEKLTKEISEAQKDFEKELINTAKDDFELQLQELNRELDDGFAINEIDNKDAATIQEIQIEIKECYKRLQNLIENMQSLEDKINVEKEIKLFRKKLNRAVARRKVLTERYLAKLRNETRLQHLHDFDKQIELLRNKELTFDEVIGGYEHIKTTMLELINEYKFFQKYKKGSPPKGMVLHGKPGIGKTSIVRAIAAHKGYDIVILKKKTDIDAMEHEIKAKFNESKTLAESGNRLVILLIDEIDGLGATRKVGSTDKDTIALLAEIDALKPSDGVVIFATTNQLKNVDEAVIRSGRLDQKLEIARPTETDIKEILKVKLNGLRLEEGVKIDEFVDSLISTFRDKTGADIDRTVQVAIQNRLQNSESKQLTDIILYVEDIKQAAMKLN
jgi:SpoVK/Ycf46/Vps4 family AAA+-type ATPase